MVATYLIITEEDQIHECIMCHDPDLIPKLVVSMVMSTHQGEALKLETEMTAENPVTYIMGVDSNISYGIVVRVDLVKHATINVVRP